MSELTGGGDFNRDGRADLIARQNATGYLMLYPGGAGGFGAPSRIGIGWNVMRDITGTGDFDRDGFADVIAVHAATGDLYRYPGRGTHLSTGLKVGHGWGGMSPLL